jgi:hypothetical protein
MTTRSIVITLVMALMFSWGGRASAEQAKCLAGKLKCVSMKGAGLLTCERLAETPGRIADPNAHGCVDKVNGKFDGGVDPASGCFEKLESKTPNDCITVDDTGAAEGMVDSCVAAVAAAIDPPPITQTKCGAGKKKCVANYLKARLKCEQLAATPGKAFDPNARRCVDKAVAKYTGGSDPTKGCFAKLESKNPNDCQFTNDSATLQGVLDNCVNDLVDLVTLTGFSQAAQNYFVESILGGAYNYQPFGFYADYSADGLLTKGLSRFTENPAICLIGGTGSLRSAVGKIVASAVETLTHGHLHATFAADGCFEGLPTACSNSCEAVPPNQINVFLDPTCTSQGIACYEGGDDGETFGARIKGGILLEGGLTGSLPLTREDREGIRHELGHVFGLEHTWGDPDLMSYRQLPFGPDLDFVDHERQAFAKAYQLQPGARLNDLIQQNLITDVAAVLNAPPSIEATYVQPFTRITSAPVGSELYLRGQRMTLAFCEEYHCSFRPHGYAPPVLEIGGVPFVPDLRQACQEATGSYSGTPAGMLKVRIPQGAGAGTLKLTTRGQTAEFPSFTIAGAPLTSPSSTPRAVGAFTCTRPAGSGGKNVLQWTLPSTYADQVTPLVPSKVRVRIVHNGEYVADVPGTTTAFTDPTVYPGYLTDLYQVVVLNGTSCNSSTCSFDSTSCAVGIPSAVCQLAPRQ